MSGEASLADNSRRQAYHKLLGRLGPVVATPLTPAPDEKPSDRLRGLPYLICGHLHVEVNGRKPKKRHFITDEGGRRR